MESETGIKEIEAIRLSASDRATVSERCGIVVEQPLTITVDGVGTYTLMCMPCDTMSLAVGFAFTEGIIRGISDIDLIRRCDDDPCAMRIRVKNVPEKLTERNLIVASSCGMCGNLNVEETLAALPKCTDTFRVGASLLREVLAGMKSRQSIFNATGGTHAAAIFTPAESGLGGDFRIATAQHAEIISFAEDIGRHNALDKAIGRCILAETSTRGCGVALSGRVSLEMVVKAARAGIELITAVSAPTSLAIDAAGRSGITLCCFVREDRATVFTYPHRVEQ